MPKAGRKKRINGIYENRKTATNTSHQALTASRARPCFPVSYGKCLVLYLWAEFNMNSFRVYPMLSLYFMVLFLVKRIPVYRNLKPCICGNKSDILFMKIFVIILT